MPTWTGYFNNRGQPVIKLFISGIITQNQREFEAVIDTGFSGFISMPILAAFPLGLVLRGSMPLTYADGSTADKLYALGIVSVGAESSADLIILEQGPTDVLAGMQLLSVFHKRLVVSPETNTVLLEDEPPPPLTATPTTR